MMKHRFVLPVQWLHQARKYDVIWAFLNMTLTVSLRGLVQHLPHLSRNPARSKRATGDTRQAEYFSFQLSCFLLFGFANEILTVKLELCHETLGPTSKPSKLPYLPTTTRSVSFVPFLLNNL